MSLKDIKSTGKKSMDGKGTHSNVCMHITHPLLKQSSQVTASQKIVVWNESTTTACAHTKIFQFTHENILDFLRQLTDSATERQGHTMYDETLEIVKNIRYSHSSGT